MSGFPEPFYRGKVRDLYPVDDKSMIITATDRISAFDVVFDEPMADKGKMLHAISLLWFLALRKSGLYETYGFKDQLLAWDFEKLPRPYSSHEYFRDRSIHVRKTKRIDFECVVRGYIVGSGWKDYQNTGSVCGHKLSPGLKLAEKLPEPLFTPATKAPLGEHDENVSIDRMREDIGEDLANHLQSISIGIYEYAHDKLSELGIILCDTKFEFGLEGDEVVLIDEVLTPDSSRYWHAAAYRAGTNPPSFDKQIVRDYLETLAWNKKAPAPPLPAEIAERTMSRYHEIQEKIRSLLT